WVVDAWSLPLETWVVSAIETSGGDATPEQVTRFHYSDPAWLQDDDGRYGFRGFREVSSDTPTNAHVSTTFDYTTFFGGLPTETVISDSTVAGEPPRTIDQTQWTTLTFHGTPVIVAGQHDTRTCGASQDLVACRSSGALLRTVTDWSAFPASGAALALLPSV